MRRSRFTEERVIGILKEADSGVRVSEVARRYGISEQTFYKWKSRYGGLDASYLKRLKQLEDENRRLKHLVADLTLDNAALRAALLKK